jgi:lysophospholipase L1-like esterase
MRSMPMLRRYAGMVAAAILALSLLAPGARAAPGGGVLVVGDSLEELTSPYLAKFLPGVPLTINAVGGYNSYQILELFEESYDPSQRVIVFDAGTNDNPSYPQILAENLGKVAATVGDRCMVVPTIHGLHPGGVDDSGKNRTVAEFAASRPGTQTPDWQGAVFSHPELMQADNLHPIEAGAELRARLIAQGVMACLAGSTGGSASSAPSRGPALAEAPARIPQLHEMERREVEISRAIGMELLRQTAASTLGALL